jgi:SSS family solute:Na+ symporter
MDLFTIVVILAYLLATCYLGYVGWKRTKTAADYLVAGRSAHPVVMALSYGATFISTSAIVGFGGAAANFGMGLLWLTFLNIFVGIFIAFVFLGGPTRRMGHHLDAHTFPELMGRRYDSRFIQIFIGLVIFLFMPLYAMAVMLGMAQFLSSEFMLSLDVALLICAIIVAAYTIAGGLKGVMLNDALQAAVMLVGMVVLLGGTYAALGGVTNAHQALTDMADKVPPALKAIGHRGWTAMPAFGFAPAGSKPPEAIQFHMWWILVSTIVLGVGIGVLAQPQLIVRFMTVKSRQSLNRAVISGGIFILFMTGVAFVVGPLSNVYFAQKEAIACTVVDENVLFMEDAAKGGVLIPLPADASEELKAKAKTFVAYRLPGEPPTAPLQYVLKTPALRLERGAAGSPDILRPGLIAIARSVGPGITMKGDMDRIIPYYIKTALPKWFRIIFLLTLLSAAMSTMSSQFHAMGTSLGRDVYEQLAHRHSAGSVLATRLAIGIGIVVSLVLGKMIGLNIIAKATAIFFGLCAASFLPAFVLGLTWKRMNRAGALASILVGFLVSLFWMVFINADTAGKIGLCQAWFGKAHLVGPAWSPTWTVVDQLVIALPLSFLVAWIVPLLTRPMDPAYVAYCFGGPKPGAAPAAPKA